MKQQALTPEQYAALGYVQRADFDVALFDVKPDAPLPQPMFDLAYRANEKSDYYIDVAYGLFKVGTAYASGGVLPAGKTALTYTFSLLG